jgi:hypothetical protein
MKKGDLQAYLNRWKLVAEIEKQEIKEAPFELLMKQTLSIWDMSKALGFDKRSDSSEEILTSGNLWLTLHKRWNRSHA